MDGAESSQMSAVLAREIVRQSEARLDALTDLGTAADLRATTLCGVFGASAVGIGAGTLTYVASTSPFGPLVLAGSSTTILLFFASLIAACAGAPSDFWIGGGSPDMLIEWAWDKGKWRDETDMLIATCHRHAKSIQKNDRGLRRRAKWLVASLCIAGAAPVVGAMAFLCGQFLYALIKHLV